MAGVMPGTASPGLGGITIQQPRIPPLIVAAQYGRGAVAQLLLERKASPSAATPVRAVRPNLAIPLFPLPRPLPVTSFIAIQALGKVGRGRLSIRPIGCLSEFISVTLILS